MNRRGVLGLFAIFVAVALVAGCHRDPNVRKQKYLESGKRYSAAGKYREAAIQYLNALKVDKSFSDAHFELAQAYEHLGQYNLAYAELLRTVALQPGDFKARIALGNILLAGSRTDDAQTQANAVVAAQPNNPDVHALLSAIALKRGQKDQAITEIQHALQLDPNRASFYDDLAMLQVSDPAKTSDVEDELKKSIVLDPKSVNAKLLLAAYYARNGRWPEAVQTDEAAIATDPKSMAAREDLARVYLQQGNQAKAEEVLRQASKDLSDNAEGVRVLADYYANSGQLDKARAEFSTLAAKYPKNTSVQKGYVRVLLQVKDFAAAQTVVAGLMKNNPKDPEIAGLNGIVLLNNGKTIDAVNALQDAAKNFPKDTFLLYWLGRAAVAEGDSSLGEKSFREVVELNPALLDAQAELSVIAAQRGDMNLLGEVADKTIAAAPRFGDGYVWRAMVELSHNSPEKAEGDLNTAIGVSPKNPLAYVQLGKIRLAEKRYPEGVKLLEQALEYDPANFEALRMLVSYDRYQKHPDQALALLNTQIEKTPNNSGIYDLLAQVQFQNKNLDQAAAAAQKAIQLNSSDGSAVTLFAQIQLQRGQTATAISAWEKWLNTHPNDASALAVLGTLEEARGDKVRAVAYYNKALAIQPKQAVAANNLAYRMLEDGGNVDVALSLAQTARQGMPNSSSAADTLAWAYYNKGTYGFARDLLENAVKDAPNDAVIQYHLGMVYSKLSDKSNAAIHLKKALSLAPDSPPGKAARAALQGKG